MLSNFRKIVVTVLLIISTGLFSYTAYSAYLYYGMYNAVRIFNVAIKSFDVEISNSTGQIATVITILNPSEYPFHVAQIYQTLYLHWEYFGKKMWTNHPTKILPRSTIDASSSMQVPETKIPLINATSQLEWFMELEFWLSAPLVRRLRLTFGLFPE